MNAHARSASPLRVLPRLETLEARHVPSVASVIASGDVDADGVADLVLGAMPGMSPRVRVVNGWTGEVVLDLDAYDPSFTGGVSVGTGDINGDGYSDIVLAPGEGGGPHVRVLDGRTGGELQSFFAFEAEFRGGVNFGVGDTTGDGVADLMVSPGGGGGPRVRVQDSRTQAWVADYFAYTPDLRGGVTLATADVNRDGMDDVIVGAGRGGGPRVTVFSGSSTDVLTTFFAYDSSIRNGVHVAGARYPFALADGILTSPGEGGGPHVKLFRAGDWTEVASFLADDPAARGGTYITDLPGFDGTDVNSIATLTGGVVSVYSPVTGERYVSFALDVGGVGTGAFRRGFEPSPLPDGDRDGASDWLEVNGVGSDPYLRPVQLNPLFIPSALPTLLFTGSWAGEAPEPPESDYPNDVARISLQLTQRRAGISGTSGTEFAPAGVATFNLVGEQTSPNTIELDEYSITSQRNTNTSWTWALKKFQLGMSDDGMTLSGQYDGNLPDVGVRLTRTSPLPPPGEYEWSRVATVFTGLYAQYRGDFAVAAFAHQVLNLAELSYPARYTWADGIVIYTFSRMTDDFLARPEQYAVLPPGITPTLGFATTGSRHVRDHLVPYFTEYIKLQFQLAAGGGLAALDQAAQVIVSDHEQFLANAVIPGMYAVSEVSPATQASAAMYVPTAAGGARRTAFALAARGLYDRGVLSHEQAMYLVSKYGTGSAF